MSLSGVAIAAMLIAIALGANGNTLMISALVLSALGTFSNMRELPAMLEASHDGLRVNGELVARATIRSAIIRREGARTFVAIRHRDRIPLTSATDVEVARPEAGAWLCRTLGVDAECAPAELDVFDRGRQLWSAAALLSTFVAGTTAIVGAKLIELLRGASLTHGSSLQLCALIMATLALIPIFARPSKLTIGADGIELRIGWKRPVYCAHAEIDDVRCDGGEVIIVRRHGAPIRFDVGWLGKLGARLDIQARAIADRIDSARRVCAASGDDITRAAKVLDRAGRPTADWLTQLQRLGAGATGTFREPSLTREQLWRILESSSAGARDRIAAAVALRTGLTEEEKPRVRIGVESSAQPALRDRLVRVALAPTDDAVMREMEALEEMKEG